MTLSAVQPPGTPYRAAWYISRPHEERLALRYLEFSQPVLLWGPRRQGRSWLWNRVAEMWLAAADPSETRSLAVVDARSFATSAFASLDACLRALADAIADALDDSLDLGLRARVEAIWEGRGDGKRKINELMARAVLPSLPGPLLLVLEHADLVHRCAFYNDFAGLLRSWAEKSQSVKPWSRLRLLVSVSTHPARLATEEHQSPFANLSDPITIGDLEPNQIGELLTRHGLSFTDADVGRLMAVVGGQPYLLRAALVDILDGRYTLDALAAGEPLGPSLITDHLRLHRTRLAASPALAAAFTEVARDPHASVPEAVLDDLIRQGLITQGEGGSRRVRYRLYERLLQAEAQPSSARRKLRVFYSYAREDEGLRDRLAVHLKLLERQGLIEPWHDREILPGGDWAGAISQHLEGADLIVLLVSADFVASSYCWDVELQRALSRHAAGEASVVPILLRPCDWSSAPFAKLRALPTTKIPVTRWPDQEDAWAEIAQDLRKVITGASSPAA